MGLLQRLRSPMAATPSPWSDVWYAPRSFTSAAGIRVTPETALTLSAVWSAISQLSRDVASMPLITYRRLPDGGKERATNHPLYDVLRYQPNPWQTAFEFWEMLVGHVLLRGMAYAQIMEGPRGFADQLIPRHPDRITAERLPNGNLRYQWQQPNGQKIPILQDEMFVIRGFSSDGLSGMSVIEYGAQSFGASLATDSYVARFYSQNATPAAVLEHPHVVGEEALKNLRTSVQSYTQGLDNAHGFLILEEGMKWTQIGVKPEDAQLLASREFGIEDVARWFGMPLHKLSVNKQAQTYGSREQANLEYVVYSLRPINIRIEQCIRRDLILATQAYFSEFLIDSLLRGDSAARGEYFWKMFQMAAYSPNDILEIDNRNPVPGGDRRFVPANMIPVDMAGQVSQQAGSSQQSGSRAASIDVRAILMAQEAAQRVVRKEVAAASRAAQKFAHDGEGWSAWLRAFYSEHAGFVAQTLRIPLPIAKEYAAKQGLRLEQHGIGVLEDAEWTVASELAQISLGDGDTYAARTQPQTPVQVTVPVTIDRGAVQVDARTTIEGAKIDVQPANTTITDGAVRVTLVQPPATQGAKVITFQRQPSGEVTGATVEAST